MGLFEKFDYEYELMRQGDVITSSTLPDPGLYSSMHHIQVVPKFQDRMSITFRAGVDVGASTLINKIRLNGAPDNQDARPS